MEPTAAVRTDRVHPAVTAAEADDAGITRMDIWAQMRLDMEGRAENVHFPDAEGYSPELLSALGLRMALARFEPFEKEGRTIAVTTRRW